MNSKTMLNWSGVFLCLAGAGMLYGLINDKDLIYSGIFCVMATIYNVGSAIMNKLESMTVN